MAVPPEAMSQANADDMRLDLVGRHVQSGEHHWSAGQGEQRQQRRGAGAPIRAA